ncbi:MAG: serine/threonine-protein kinase [Polyangiaceae bacterium]
MSEAGEDDPLIGTLVADRYRVSRKLGEGGMGVVYQAVHEALRKPVAMKLLATSGRIDREAIARFEREAIAAANLKHPNIAEATDFGRLPDGTLYLVMEYVEGTTLRKVLREQGKLDPARALGVLQQIAAALATAHASDVVHRDLKPENVIVRSVTGADGAPADHVKVIDFGIAKIRNATFGGGVTGLTKAGTVFGTPEYMAPEQVMGQATDARADQYALGVLAFELLTGKAPFKADDVGQLMMMHVGAPVPSTRDRVPSLSPEVDAVVSKMLSKLPDERFASVGDAMSAMAAAFAGSGPNSGVSAGPASNATVRLGAQARAMTPSGGTISIGSGAYAPGTLPSIGVAAIAGSLPSMRDVTSPVSIRDAASQPSLPSISGVPAQGSLPPIDTFSMGTATQGSLPPLSAHMPRIAAAVPSRKPPWAMIGVGAGSLLIGALLVILLARSCGGAPSLSSDLSAAVGDWKSGKLDTSAQTIRAALTDNPKLAENEELAQGLASQVGTEPGRRALAGLMDTTALGKSAAMASALATMAVKDDPQVRDAALDLVRDRQDLLNPEQGARVRLRDAPRCDAFESAKNEEGKVATAPALRDLERLDNGECKRIVRVPSVCDCRGGAKGGPSGGPRDAPPASGNPHGGPPGKSKKDKGRWADD